MSALQAYLVLCVIGLAVAAPQGDLEEQRSEITRKIVNPDIDQAQVVSEVAAALKPAIQIAVEEALAALQTSSLASSGPQAQHLLARVSTTSSSGSSAKTGLGISSNEGSDSGLSSNFGSNMSANKDSGLSSGSYGSGSGQITKPVYNFEYKVAAEKEQTYLSQSEQRDGENLTGSFSYVDPTGALVTVNYKAGPKGFSQTVDKEDGFVAIKPKQMHLLTSRRPSLSSGAASDSESLTNSGNPTPVNSDLVTSVNADSASTSGGGSKESSTKANKQQLIDQIISELQPKISAAVKAALSKSSSAVATVLTSFLYNDQ